MRILVLDDEPLIGRALRRALSGHEVEVATDAREVLRRARTGDSWNLILCDLMMPEMSGMEFFEALGTDAPTLRERVVFMTGGAFTTEARMFFASLENPRLEKPFDAAAVQRVIDEMRRAS